MPCSRRETLYVVKSGTREPVRSTIPSDFLQSFFKDRVRPLPQKTTKNPSITYANAGVDIDRGNKTKKRIKYLAHKTFTKGVLSEIGGFGGLFAIDKTKYQDPVLVSSVDGVDKLKIAFEMNLHSTIGGDLVNHCVNDIAVQGAAPMFFMDYLATGKLDPTVAEQVIEGLANACKHNGCALIGGETAEMPGFYPKASTILPDSFWAWSARKNHYRQERADWRHYSWLGLQRSAYKRIFAGPKTAIRGRWLHGGFVRK